MRLPFFRRGARIVPGSSANPGRTSANASAGRRGAWFSIGARGGTRQALWTSPQPRVDGTEQDGAGSEAERMQRVSSRTLRWLAVLIAIVSAFVAFTLVTD
jgi:hypothetical protein